jgi:hypothetical protein
VWFQSSKVTFSVFTGSGRRTSISVHCDAFKSTMAPLPMGPVFELRPLITAHAAAANDVPLLLTFLLP